MAKGYRMRITEAEAARRIKEKTDGRLEYVSGYTIKENPIRVRCLICGGEFERTYHNITTKGSVSCPICTERNRAERKLKAQAEKERQKQKDKATRWSRTQLLGMRVCVECGELFIPRDVHNIRCSAACTRKAANRSADARLNRSNVIDRDITLHKLFKRDGGICQICGGACEWNDKRMTPTGTVVGNNYPSIDHVIPLARGGVHSWDNVQLAHWYCNTIKSDKIVYQTPLPKIFSSSQL